MLQVLHDLKLFEDVPHFISLHALELVHILHGVHLLSVLLLHDTHLENRTASSVSRRIESGMKSHRLVLFLIL